MMKTEEIAEELIKYRTVSPVEESEVFEFMKGILEDHGVNAEIKEIDGVYNLVAETGSGGTSVCLNGHLDVVEPEGEWSITEPFKPVVRDGKLYGRGATDMKGEVAAQIKAFLDLHQDSEFNDRTVLMLVGDEEIGGFNGSKPLIEEYYGMNKGFDYALVGEPTDLNIQVGTRGVVWVNVVLEGEGVHASRAEMAEMNVMEELPKALEKIQGIDLKCQNRGVLPDPTMEVTKIDSTDTYNSIPGEVIIGVDIRYLPGQSVQGIVERIDRELETLGCGVRVEVEQDHGGAFELDDENLMSTATEALEKVLGRKPEHITEGGASDGRFFAEKNTAFIELGLNQESVHGENEYCSISKMRQLREGYYRIIKNISSQQGQPEQQ